MRSESPGKIGSDTYGFEPSKPFYERAILKMGISQEKLKPGMIEEVDYPDDYFDFISFGVVLKHVYDPSSSIRKALKWLKQDGIIHIEVPSANWLINRLINFYYKIKRTDYLGNISPLHEPYHLHKLSLDSFKLNSERNNFEIAFHEYYVCKTFLPEILEDSSSLK